MNPKTISKATLLNTLKHMFEAIEADDSFEGSIEYSATPERHMFEARAFFRVGNSEGQGGSIIIGDTSK